MGRAVHPWLTLTNLRYRVGSIQWFHFIVQPHPTAQLWSKKTPLPFLPVENSLDPTYNLNQYILLLEAFVLQKAHFVQIAWHSSSEEAQYVLHPLCSELAISTSEQIRHLNAFSVVYTSCVNQIYRGFLGSINHRLSV